MASECCFIRLRLLLFRTFFGLWGLYLLPLRAGAQAPQAPNDFNQAPQAPTDFNRIEPETLPESPPSVPQQLPPADNLLNAPPQPVPQPDSPDNPDVIEVKGYRVEGSTVFKQAELDKITQPFTGEAVPFSQLLEARSAITQHYIDEGYITSGAYLPAEQVIEDGIVTLQVVEGKLEAIEISGNKHLKSSYVRKRLQRGSGPPLNVNELLEAMRLLQIDPLIGNLSAELTAGSESGLSVLQVEVEEASTFDVQLVLDNQRSGSIGSFQRQIVVSEANLFGFGDAARLGYANTDGSNEVDFSYTFPVNARNGTLGASFSQVWSRVIEEPFDQLDIEGTSRDMSLTFRQPVIQTPQKELALGITLGRQESETFLGGRFGIPRVRFPLSPGADEEGRTKITQLRLFQEWTQRGNDSVLALRSEFGAGLDLFSTINPTGPDGLFFLWRGQAQWVKQFAPNNLLLLRSSAQFSDRALVPLQQYGLGGLNSVRGYPQNRLLVDNGLFGSAEYRLPIVRLGNNQEGLLQLAPFVDIGHGWSHTPGSDAETLAAVGLGLRWQWSDLMSARLDWGIPILSIGRDTSGFDDSQLFFSIVVSPF
ncbi:ShlB/FhaC/HecB family hemolysin secretion/activation protein [Acaryochloris sp. IP29b_bin.148]|uniref:ShlB/FhaC/HecB family hemolysin secretion/activation protein n=1 Tax=Acaryochloris sp. IP29b_bin.148 TaxID=2969218 RepID=UPI002623156F|nr:ShlB/FhaC/HecB family hemolysin secretion/activation protein [Acaryochloris sp. IP29b_bin.148]